MKNRLTLHQTLVDILGSNHVYYNPPESLKLEFPCIVYNISTINSVKADNKNYINYDAYKIIVVSKKVDNPAIRSILELPRTRYVNRYTRDGLYHDVIILNQ